MTFGTTLVIMGEDKRTVAPARPMKTVWICETFERGFKIWGKSEMLF